MDLTLTDAKKLTLNDQQIHDFHNSCIAILRWKLGQELKISVLSHIEDKVEFLHSQYLYHSGLTSELLYQVFLGDRLKYDSNYLLRILRSQSKTDLVKCQSNMTNKKLKAIYPEFLRDLFVHFENPENDKALIKVNVILDKWSM